MLGQCTFVEEAAKTSAASFLKESLEMISKENKELQAQVSQLMAELDARMLPRAQGELSFPLAGTQGG